MCPCFTFTLNLNFDPFLHIFLLSPLFCFLLQRTFAPIAESLGLIAFDPQSRAGVQLRKLWQCSKRLTTYPVLGNWAGSVKWRKLGSYRHETKGGWVWEKSDPQIIFLSNEKLKVHVGRIGRLVQQLWQTKIYVKGGKAGNQGKKNQNMCEYFPNILGESCRHGFSVFPLQFLVIDLFIVVAREQRRKNTKWRSMLVQGQTNMTDIVKDWQTKRLFKCLKEASSNWKKKFMGRKKY